MYNYQVELWDAINDYAESCGGDTSNKTARRPARMQAVVEVEKIIERILASQQANSADAKLCTVCDPNNEMKYVANYCFLCDHKMCE